MIYKLLSELQSEDKCLYGGKATNLGLLISSGFNVPKGIAIEAGWSLDVLKIRDISQRKEKIAKDIESVLKNFEGMQLAVRSSAIKEDLATMSYAGLYDTVLNVDTLTQVVDAVNQVALSLHSEHIEAYSGQASTEDNLGIGIIIQVMVKSTKSGVMFTANPITGNRSELVINSTFGYGVDVVDGNADIDETIIDKNTLESAKNKNSKSILTLDEVRQLSKVGIAIELINKRPQDIEWSFDNEHLFILQTRDITTLYPIEEEHLSKDKLHLYMCYNTVIQGMSAPFTPLGHEFWRTTFAGYTSIYYNQKKKILYPSFIKSINGRLHYDLTEVVGKRLMGKNLPSNLDSKDPAGGQLMTEIYVDYLKLFRRQGGRFKLSYGIVKWGLSLMKYGKISRKNPQKGLEEVHQLANAYMGTMESRIKAAISIEDKIRLLEDVTEENLTLAFKLVMYCAYGLKAMNKQEKWLVKKYGEQMNLDAVKQGLPNNPTTEMGISLAHIAKVSVGLSDEGLVKSSAFETFLNNFGHRGNLDIDMGTARWTEDPRYLIDLIRLYQEEDQYEDIINRYEQQQKDAGESLKVLHAKVKKDFGAKRATRIISDLENYRMLAGIREVPKFFAVKVLAKLRGMFLEIGQEMVKRQALESAEDIAYLYVKEMMTDMDDYKTLVEERKRTYHQQSAYKKVPRFILSNGDVYWQPRMTKSNSDMKGMPLSSGVVEGVVKILNTPIEAKIDKDTIIVCHNTDPSWTPLFLSIKGLIMESGGPISHGAIVAREYGLPAIGGVSEATIKMKNGQRIRMDGRSGHISFL